MSDCSSGAGCRDLEEKNSLRSIPSCNSRHFQIACLLERLEEVGLKEAVGPAPSRPGHGLSSEHLPFHIVTDPCRTINTAVHVVSRGDRPPSSVELVRVLLPVVSLVPKMVLSFILVQNRQGKTRLAKWYAPYTDEEKVKLKGEVRNIWLSAWIPHI